MRNRGIKKSGAQAAAALDSSNPRLLPVAITCGDPAGIGPEIILRALELSRRPRTERQKAEYRIVGSKQVFEREQNRLGTKVDLSLVDDSVPAPGRYVYGRPQKNCGRAALAALENGVELLKSGQVGALVTAPVSKEALRMAGFRWPGQTEFLAERLGAPRHAMLAWTPRFKVVMVTIHLPLSLVARHITAEAVFEKAALLDQFLRHGGHNPNPPGIRDCVPRQPICVLALNPHSYEFSRGEEARIEQGIALCRKAGIDAVGPVPADAALASLLAPRPSPLASSSRLLDSSTPRSIVPFSGFVAMYHDQAMIPAKLLAQGRGVNVTLGLGYVRTSPLHGTAFDIAGKGVASPGSMVAALCLARRLAAVGARN